ncbi:MAG TPA: (d)CMP kinase [Candidatus Paceibacterota bacterium]
METSASTPTPTVVQDKQNEENGGIINLDGPSASGKGATSEGLAAELGMIILPSGDLYRTASRMFALDKIDHTDTIAASDYFAQNVERVKIRDGIIFLDGICVGDEIRTEEIDELVKHVSRIPMVRSCLLPIQRGQINKKGLIAEGQDMTTVVFPEADLKVYLDAPLAVRASRRYKQRRKKFEKLPPGHGQKMQTFEEIYDGLAARDKADMERKESALQQTPEMLYINSHHKTLEQVVGEILAAWRALLVAA